MQLRLVSSHRIGKAMSRWRDEPLSTRPPRHAAGFHSSPIGCEYVQVASAVGVCACVHVRGAMGDRWRGCRSRCMHGYVAAHEA